MNQSNQSENDDLLYLIKTKNEHISIMVYEHKNTKNVFNQFFTKEENRNKDKLLSDFFTEIYPVSYFSLFIIGFYSSAINNKKKYILPSFCD